MTTYELVGQLAPPFTLVADDQQERNLNDLAGENGTLLIFVYGTYCPTCVNTFFNLAREQERFARLGVGIGVVSLDDWKTSNIFKLGMRRKMAFPILADEDGTVHKAYHTYNTSFCAAYITPDGIVAAGQTRNDFPGVKSLQNMLTATT